MSKKSRSHSGMVAQRTQDRSHSSVTVVTYARAPEPRKSNYVTVNCTKCNKPMRFMGAAPDEPVCSDCHIKEEQAKLAAEKHEVATRLNRICKVCGKPFYIKQSKVEKLKALGFEPFACCYACQQKKAAVHTDKKDEGNAEN